MDSASGYPVQGAILLGAYLIAEQVAVGEDDSDARARMERALGAMEETLREVSGDFFVTGERPDLSSLVHGVPIDERRALLVELAYSNPFDPFEFRLKGAREKSRIRGLRMLSRAHFGLGSAAADEVIDTWITALKQDRRGTDRPGQQASRLAVMTAGGAVGVSRSRRNA